MFKKALAHQSNAIPIKSSARRALLNDIFGLYPSLADAVPDHETKEHTAEREKAQRELGKLILPDGIRRVSIETSGGVEGSLYLSRESGDPLWMTFGRASRDLIPTLYLLALPLPRPPLPILRLHYPLPPPILTGAPLFIGAVRDLERPWLLPEVQEGDLVAFVTAPADDHSGEVVYVGVGRLVAPGGLRQALDRRREVVREGKDVDEGKFCDILCIAGDHLWESGSKPKMETFLPPPPHRPLEPNPDQPKHRGRTEAGPSTSGPSGTDIEVVTQGIKDVSTADPVFALTPSEVSTLLSASLLQALSDLEPSAFPMSASSLYSTHILPSRPAYIPRAQRDDVVIGKSEWKKLAKWMKEVGKDGLVRIKESKGEVTVVSFDAHHASLEGHVPFLTIAQAEARAAKKAVREAAAAQDESSGLVQSAKGKGKELAIEELWKPASGNMLFWEACGIDNAALQPANRLKPLVEEYILRHDLADPSNKARIILDEELGRAVGVKKPDPGETLSREEILKRLRSGVSWSVSIGGQVKKGSLQPVTLSVKTRQGRKTVTLISGLEAFGVDVDDLAEELKKLCAGSASVQPLTGASPKLNLKEIMVQGSQVKVVTDALISRGVPKRFIKEGDKR